MFCFFTYLSFSYDVCPCEHESKNSNNCCCAGLRFRSEYPEDCYPLTKKSILRKCPPSHFEDPLPLGQWLLRELLCITVDNRKVKKIENAPLLSNINTTNFRPKYNNRTSEFSVKSDHYSPKDLILNSAQKVIYISTKGATNECVDTLPLNFLYSSDSSQCLMKQPLKIFAYKDLVVPKAPASKENAVIKFRNIETDQIYTPANLTDASISELHIHVFYSATGLIEEIVFNFKVTTVVGLYFFTNSVEYIEFGSNITDSFRSGDVGYQLGGNIIAAQSSIQGKDVFLSFNDKKKFANVFPVPLGECLANQVNYIPLKFGSETFSGCTAAAPGINYSNYYIAKHANPKPDLKGDWVPITRVSKNDCSLANQFSFTFYTSKVGKAKRPVYLIDHVNMECTKAGTEPFKMSSTFVEIPQKTLRYIGKFPVRLAKIPKDFFYPFSSPEK